MKNSNGLPFDILQNIAEMYGLEIDSIIATEGGYRNLSHSFLTKDGRRLNFILYKREPDSVELIKRTNALGLHTARKGLSVRHPADERILKVGGRYGSLYDYLPGETIPWESYSMKHIKLLGWGLAGFHTAAEDFTGDLPNVEDVYLETCGRMESYFADQNVVRALREKLNLSVFLPDFNPMLVEAKKLTRTVLHMDFVRSNVLFGADSALRLGRTALTGMLDLEKAARGHQLFDLARTLAFLLVDCAKPAEKVQKYFLESGYKKRGGRSVESVWFEGENLLEKLMTMFLVYDFYKFLRQNPFESLPENHHFLGTERILRDHKVLQ